MMQAARPCSPGTPGAGGGEVQSVLVAQLMAAEALTAVIYVEGGYLEMDYHAYADLAAELNPDVEAWAGGDRT